MYQDFIEIAYRMQNKKILVIGDVVADIYLDGRISRISREAPVLVLEQAGEKIVAGGAANVINNIATLQGYVYGVGMVGKDNAADGLRYVLGKNGANTDGFIVDDERPTISKTRVVAGGRATVSQQIVRIDKECKEPLKPAQEEKLLSYIKKMLPKAQGVVLSDYGSGTVTAKIRKCVIDYCNKHDIPSIVDSRYDILGFKGIKFVKQNDAELADAYETTFKNDKELEKTGRRLLKDLQAEGVLITLGERGMKLFCKDGSISDIPVVDMSEVFDVSGAGDTCVATMILALAAGIKPLDAARLSNIASGIAVRKQGTATVSSMELMTRLVRCKSVPESKTSYKK